MNKKIYVKFLEAEEKGEKEIQKVFSRFFSEYENDYEKMAELMIIVDDRLESNLDKKELLSLYIELRSKITAWSNENLDIDENERFCELTDNYCIERNES